MLKRKAASCADEHLHLPAKRCQLDSENEVSEGKNKNSIPLNIVSEDSIPKVGTSNCEEPTTSLEKSIEDKSKVASALAKQTSSEEDVDEVGSTNSHISSKQSHSGQENALSDASSDDDSDSDSDIGENRWLPVAGPMSWVQKQMQEGKDPRAILTELLPNGADLPEGLHEVMLWKLIVSVLSEPPRRKKIETYNTIEDLINLVKTRSRVIVLTGAGVSVSCGIPDFRSRDGLYARLALEYPDLPDPQSMFDIQYFKRNPYPFFKFAKEIYPGKFNPSISHKFIKLLESKGKLLRNYTQNIDTLEQVAGIERVVQCHGSFATATCMACKARVTCAEVKEEIMNQEIPKCRICPPDAEMPIIKPDIVFFGENLPEEFHEQIAEDKAACDLLIVIGSSLKVRPVSLIPNSLPSNVPQILINRETLPHQTFDIELLGDCDVIVQELARQLGWEELSSSASSALKQIGFDELKPPAPPEPKSDNNRFKLRVPSEVIIDQSLCSTDMDASQISANRLNLRGDYLSPLEGSQLSAIRNLKVNSNTCTSEQPSPNATQPQSPSCSESMLTSNFESQSGIPAVVSELITNQSVPSTSSQPPESIDEHSFSGKLGSPKNIQEDILPSTSSSAERDDHIRQNISTRLPDNTFLYMEPARYIFPGAEFLSDDDADEDSDDYEVLSPESVDNAGSLHVDDTTDVTPHTSDIDTSLASSDNEGASNSRKFLKPISQEKIKIISHDEDAIDAFPENSNNTCSSSTTDNAFSNSHSSQSQGASSLTHNHPYHSID